MEDSYWERAYTVYDAYFDNSSQQLPGAYILAAVFASKEQADQVLALYRAVPRRYDVRPAAAGAIAKAALEIADRYERGRA